MNRYVHSTVISCTLLAGALLLATSLSAQAPAGGAPAGGAPVFASPDPYHSPIEGKHIRSRYDGKGNIIGMNPGIKALDVKPAKGGQGDVDAITASTITTRAFLKAINQAYDAYFKK